MSFTFKQFHIDDAHCAMKVGTDGVLLGAWAPVDQAHHLLDLGCGSGLMSLMVAQRAPSAQIVGVEIDTAAANDAQQNVLKSPFSNRIKIIADDALQFAQSTKLRFDCIISNPPYYEEDVLPPSAFRAKARHTTGGGLNFNALLHCVDLLLDKSVAQSRFSVILPTQATESFISAAAVHGLYLAQRTNVVTRPQKPCKRVLLCFTPYTTPIITSQLVLVNNEGRRSDQYQELCKDFYL